MTPTFKLLELKATYTQPADDCQKDDLGQFLELRTEDAGGGTCFVLETKRWAVEGVLELAAVLVDFISRGAGLLPGAGASPAPTSAGNRLADSTPPAEADGLEAWAQGVVAMPTTGTTTTGQCPDCFRWGPWGAGCMCDEGQPGAAFGAAVRLSEPSQVPVAEPETKRGATLRWTEQENADFDREYATKSNAALAIDFNRSVRAVELHAVQRGLKKATPHVSPTKEAKPLPAAAPAVAVAPAAKAKIDPALRTQVRQKAKAIVKKKEEQAKKKPEVAVTAAFIRTLPANDPARLAYQLDGIRGYERHLSGMEVRRA